MTPVRTLYRLEVRPLITDRWIGVVVWNPRTAAWDRFSLKRGQWYTAHLRPADDRFVFTAAPGLTRRLLPKDRAERGARAFRKRGYAARVVAVEVKRWHNISGDLDFDTRLGNALDHLAAELNIHIDVISGARSLDEQKHLYALYKAGIGNLAAVPNPNAPHVRGIAADSYVRGIPLRTVLRDLGKIDRARELGIHFPVDSEGWHAELVNP